MIRVSEPLRGVRLPALRRSGIRVVLALDLGEALRKLIQVAGADQVTLRGVASSLAQARTPAEDLG